MLNIISWNCAGGAKGKIDEIRGLITNSRPDFLFICEAEFDGTNEDYLSIADYHLDVAKSLTLGKARLICYVHKSSRNIYQRIPSLEGNNKNVLVYGNRQLRIAGVYRGFKNYNAQIKDPLQSLFECLGGIAKFDGSLIVQGDFNIDPHRDQNSRSGRMLSDWCLEAGLIQLIRNNTR